MRLACERVVVRVQQGNKVGLRLTELTEIARAAWRHVVGPFGSHEPGVVVLKDVLDVFADSAGKLGHFVVLHRLSEAISFAAWKFHHQLAFGSRRACGAESESRWRRSMGASRIDPWGAMAAAYCAKPWRQRITPIRLR
jgi:hypothetical protein